MRTIRISLFAFLAVCSTSAAWAQYGLYGSPETLQFPQPEAAQPYAAPANYPTTATPMAQAAPAQAYYPAQPQYRYPAQAAATSTYQPYQPGAQYRYPSPYARPPMRTAALEPSPQPIPAPPGMSAAPNAMQPAPPMANDPLAPQGPSMMSQMIAEQGNGGYAVDNGAYRGAVGDFQRSACSPQAEGCAYDGACCQGYCPWYVGVSALVLSRSDGRRFWTSNEPPPREAYQLGNSQIPLSWKWGGEVQIGRRFCCGCVPYAIEGTYWTADSFTGSQVTTNPNAPYTVNTPLNFTGLTFNGADPTLWWNGALWQRVTRQDEVHNGEINLVRQQLAWACDSPWDIGWSVGVRYFRFQDGLTVYSLANDGVSDSYFSDFVTNNLVGAQFGFDAAYNVCRCVRVFITPKVGIYDNFVDSNFEAKAQAGGTTYNGQTPYGDFPAHGSKTGVAFLTQIDVGADWQFSRNWSARAGYRVVAITGMALADDQFPQYMCDIPEIQNVQHTSSLVLHGAFFGLTYNF
jgi:hypothetical protein